MDNTKLATIGRILFPAMIFFMCGVLGFSTKNYSYPVQRTLELMTITAGTIYALYKVDPKPEKREKLLLPKDLLYGAILFLGGSLFAYVATDHWQMIKVLEFVSLVMIWGLLLRLISRVKNIVVKRIFVSVTMFCGMAVSIYIFKGKVDWPFLIGYSMIFLVAKLLEDRTKNEPPYLPFELETSDQPKGSIAKF